MSRSTHRQHFESHPIRRRKPTVADLAKLMGMRVKQSLRKRGLVPVKKATEWAWEFGSQGGIVAGHTRSEASSMIKQKLGIKKGRLPMGVTIKRINENQPASVGAA